MLRLCSHFLPLQPPRDVSGGPSLWLGLVFYALLSMGIGGVLFTNRASSWLSRIIHKAEARSGPLSPRMANAWLAHQLL